MNQPVYKSYYIRGTDAHGSGHYLASRGSRKHQGIDFTTVQGEVICSFCEGKVTKIGYPYDPNKYPEKGHLRYVEVEDSMGNKVRVFYINPSVYIGQEVTEYDPIGTSQDLTEIYEGITQHLHFEVKRGKEYLNPMKYLGIDS